MVAEDPHPDEVKVTNASTDALKNVLPLNMAGSLPAYQRSQQGEVIRLEDYSPYEAFCMRR